METHNLWSEDCSNLGKNGQNDSLSNDCKGPVGFSLHWTTVFPCARSVRAILGCKLRGHTMSFASWPHWRVLIHGQQWNLMKSSRCLPIGTWLSPGISPGWQRGNTPEFSTWLPWASTVFWLGAYPSWTCWEFPSNEHRLWVPWMLPILGFADLTYCIWILRFYFPILVAFDTARFEIQNQPTSSNIRHRGWIWLLFLWWTPPTRACKLSIQSWMHLVSWRQVALEQQIFLLAKQLNAEKCRSTDLRPVGALFSVTSGLLAALGDSTSGCAPLVL